MKLLKALWLALDMDVANMVAWLESIGLTLATVAIPIGFFMLLGFTVSDTIMIVGLTIGTVVILVFIVIGALGVVRYVKRFTLWYRRMTNESLRDSNGGR